MRGKNEQEADEAIAKRGRHITISEAGPIKLKGESRLESPIITQGTSLCAIASPWPLTLFILALCGAMYYFIHSIYTWMDIFKEELWKKEKKLKLPLSAPHHRHLTFALFFADD